MSIPIKGTLERIVLEHLMAAQPGAYITYLDFDESLGITDEILGELMNNLQTGMYIGEDDDQLFMDS